MISLFFTSKVHAHSDVEHDGAVEATTHYFDVWVDYLFDPIIAILLLFIVLISVYIILYKLKVNFAKTLLSLVIIDFALGVLGLIFVPPMGVVAISIGFAGAIVLVLTGIQSKS
jgi:hypothetical protein